MLCSGDTFIVKTNTILFKFNLNPTSIELWLQIVRQLFLDVVIPNTNYYWNTFLQLAGTNNGNEEAAVKLAMGFIVTPAAIAIIGLSWNFLCDIFQLYSQSYYYWKTYCFSAIIIFLEGISNFIL